MRFEAPSTTKIVLNGQVFAALQPREFVSIPMPPRFCLLKATPIHVDVSSQAWRAFPISANLILMVEQYHVASQRGG